MNYKWQILFELRNFEYECLVVIPKLPQVKNILPFMSSALSWYEFSSKMPFLRADMYYQY